MVTLNELEPKDYMQVHFPPGRQKSLYLQHIAVHPKWQRKGIAGQMIEFALKTATKRGFDNVRLDVLKLSEVAIHLFENHSFKEVAPFHAAYQQIPYLCYEKKL
jgi:ribosomal protein S18 acetylase RimI-like enzyme